MIGELPTKRTRLSVLKVEPNRPYAISIACEDVFTLQVHWLGKRSYICPGSECSACKQSIGAKWNGLVYVAMQACGSSVVRHGLFELTEAAYYRLRDHAELQGRSIGPRLEAVIGRRSRRSPLSFQSIEAHQEAPVPNQIAPMTAIADGVATLYGLPAVKEGETVAKWAARTEQAARSMIDNQVKRLF